MNRPLTRSATLAITTLLGVAVSGCGSGGMQLPSDAAGTALYEAAEQQMADEKWRNAAESYDTLLRNYPTSPHLPEARLGLGRAYYEQSRSDSYVLSVDAFRNFLTYHPSHQQVDYAQLMIALSHMGLMRSSDRDQANTREALEAFEIFLEDYPESQYRTFAIQNMQRVVDTLARHEVQVSRFQLARGRYAAARQRVHFALREYPRTNYRCELLYILAESHWYQGDGQAAGYYQRVVDEHPECEFAADAEKRIRQGGAPRPSDEDEPGNH